jgi:hypothetical protein
MVIFPSHPDDKEILIASTIKGLIYKLEKCS